jgi:Peptidase family C25
MNRTFNVCAGVLFGLERMAHGVRRSCVVRAACRGARIVALFVFCGALSTLATAVVAVRNVATSNFTSGNDCSITSLNASTGSPNLVLLAVALINGSVQSAPVFNTTPAQTFTPIGTVVGTNNIGELFVYRLGPSITAGTASITISLMGASGCVAGAVAFSGVASLGTQVTNSCSIGICLLSTTASVTGITSPGTGGVVYNALVADMPSTASPASGIVQEWQCSPGSTCTNSKILGAGGVSGPSTSASWTLSSAPSAWAMMAVPLIPSSTTAVKVNSLTATEYTGGNLIELKTGREISSLGFNLYREQNGQRVRLNSSLLAGTALLAGPKTTFTSGHSHAWLDKPEASGEAAYWVEEVDLNGDNSVFGPVFAEPAAEPRSAALSPLIAEREGSALKPQVLNELGRTPSLTLNSNASNCGPVNSGSRPFQRTGDQPAITSRTQQQQYALAAGPAIKISVCAEGWYRLTQPELLAAGLNPDVDPRLLQLYVNGVEQPMIVHGQRGGRLDPGDTLEFYGYPLNTTWSGTQVYWLVVGSTKGKRVPTEDFSAEAKAGPGSFAATVEWNPRTVYFAALLNGDADNFFGPVLGSGSPVSNSFTVTSLDTTATTNAQLEVSLQGVSSGAHAVAVQLNHYRAGTVNLSNQKSVVAKLMFPSSVLQQGSNNVLTLTVEGGQQDISVVDTVRLTYPHTYTADNDYLRLSTPAGMKQTIGGFSNWHIKVVDITDPGAVTALRQKISRQGTSYAVSFVPQGSGMRTLLAFTSAKSSNPVSLVANHPSGWRKAQAGADVVIISHANFLSSLGSLETLRQNQGHTVATINAQDLYDEFNFGVKSPYAIKKFLQTAKARWSLKPHFVLLVGDATFDPRNYLGVGEDDFVPTYLIDTQLLETASDDWFADFQLDGLPEMAVGRLPVRTASDASRLADRIANYETSSSGAWTNQVLLVAGTDDAADPFTSYISAVQTLIPGTQKVSIISQGSDANAHNDLIAYLNAGQSLVNFAGHGSDEVWAGELLSSSDAAALTNGSQTPFVISMTCLNGYFQDVYTVSLAKSIMLAPSGGAVAAWASSGLTDSPGQSLLNQAMVSALYSSQPLTLGEAAAVAKRAVNDLDIRRTWILLGDPATKLQ